MEDINSYRTRTTNFSVLFCLHPRRFFFYTKLGPSRSPEVNEVGEKSRWKRWKNGLCLCVCACTIPGVCVYSVPTLISWIFAEFKTEVSEDL